MPPKKRRQPTDPVDEAIAGPLCEWLAEGRTLRSFCRERGLARRTIDEWRQRNPEFGARVARARDIGFDAIADQCVEIADDGTNDMLEVETRDGEVREQVNHDNIQRSKLRVETRMKLLACWDPRRYGNKAPAAEPTEDRPPDPRFE